MRVLRRPGLQANRRTRLGRRGVARVESWRRHRRHDGAPGLPGDDLFLDDAFGCESIDVAKRLGGRRIAERGFRVRPPAGFERAREKRRERGTESPRGARTRARGVELAQHFEHRTPFDTGGTAQEMTRDHHAGRFRRRKRGKLSASACADDELEQHRAKRREVRVLGRVELEAVGLRHDRELEWLPHEARIAHELLELGVIHRERFPYLGLCTSKVDRKHS